jgi:signal transduction histidine kinase/ActR/RegA family two-component response regulator
MSPAVPLLPAEDRLSAPLDVQQRRRGARRRRPSARQAKSSHRVQFYEGDAYLSISVASFLAEGLAAGQAAVVIATEAHRQAFCQRLRASGVDVDGAVDRGEFVLLDARETLASLMVGSLPDESLFQARVGGVIEKSARLRPRASVRAYGEMVDLLWREGNRPAAIRLEGLWNQLGKQHSFELLCAYGLGGFGAPSDAVSLAEVCGTHTHVIPAESYSAIDTDVGRLREISLLQQRAQALENEVARRAEMEKSLRASEERLEQARAQAEAASRAKDEFLAMLGHELRNPLAPILTALHLIRLRGVDAAEKERRIIERQVRHLVRLVDDLLDVSRITRGTVELRKQRVELAEVVAKGIEMASPILEQRKQELSLSVPRTGLEVNADAVRLAQVVSNLLTNAAKYSDVGSRIQVVGEKQGDEAVLTVRDDGIGISADMLPKVFDLFVQEQQALDRSAGGLGLGLAIVRSIVRLHQGSVSARSDGRGRGSEFTIRLPAAPSETLVTPASHGDHASVRRPTPGHRVLIVDDNEDGAEVLAEMLEALGHTVHVAHDGPGALQVVRDFPPDVAFLDIGLPVMDGYELAQRLREALHSRVRLVAVTGYGQDSDRKRSRDAGFDVHLVKPVDLDDLDPLVRRLAKGQAD